MLIVIIQLPPHRSFSPFRAKSIDLFNLFNETKELSKAHRVPYISYHTNHEKTREHIDLLALQFSRFILLEMLSLNSRIDIPHRAQLFMESVSHARFQVGAFERQMPNTQQSTVYPQRPLQPSTITQREFFAHVPKPNVEKQDKAKKIALETGSNLPEECLDPITMDVLNDPIEINRRVYNRPTLTNMIENGKFKDPFTRELIDLSTAKPAHYMLDAIIEHPKAMSGIRPEFANLHKNTEVKPLLDLITIWEDFLRQRPSHSAQ